MTETPANVGKAGALDVGVQHFRLVERYDVVLLLDADTRLQPGYFEAALPLFADPEVVAVAGCAVTDWSSPRRTPVGQLLTAHRSRIYALMQRLLKFGQAWRQCNAVSIVPGFASMYRTSVLPAIDINPPGLVIKDFNMTFEAYRKQVGKVGFTLGARALTQDPDRLRDYVRQAKRWALGFWQTVRRMRPRFDLFTVAIGLFAAEVVTASVMMVLCPLLALLLGLPLIDPVVFTVPVLGDLCALVGQHLSLESMALGVLLPDIVLSVVVAAVERRPMYLLWAPLFPLLRVLDAALALWTLPLGWLRRSSGRWSSPQRRSAEEVAEVPVAA